MENPAYWGVLEHVIHDVIRQYDDTLPGLSLEMTIANALRANGLVETRPLSKPPPLPKRDDRPGHNTHESGLGR